jgi:1,2-diacylglycerol 3-alpha-glucosyltransferase
MERKMIKICMLLDNTFKPIDRRVYKEAKSLVNCGYDVTIVCKRDNDNILKEHEMIDGIRIRRYFTCNLGTSVLVEKYLEAHFDLMRNLTEKFDVYHCHDTETWPIGYILSKRDGAKFICDAHEYFPDYLQKANYHDEIKYETSKLLGLNRGQYVQYADGVITVGEQIATMLQNQYNLSSEPLVIYNTRSTAESVAGKTSLLRDEFSIDADKKILLHHGNIERSRGIENIIDALPYIKKEVILLIAGNCSKDYAQELYEYAVQKGVEYKFRYIGFLNPNKLLEYVASADVNVFFPITYTKNMEYCVPNKFFEYIFAETPFVIKNMPELVMLTEKYNIGYIADSIRNIATKVDHLLSNEQEYIDKVNKLKKAQEDLCWEKQEEKLLAFYNTLA